MRSPSSAVIANIFMEAFEQEAIGSSKLKLTYYRFVDAIWIIWPDGRETLDDFQLLLNRQHVKINFSMEIANNSALTFFNVLVKHNDSNKISHTVYYKKTYMQKRFHIRRAEKVRDKKHRSSEMQHVHNALRRNGYKTRDILRRRNEKVNENVDQQKLETYAYLPYSAGISYRSAKCQMKTSMGQHPTDFNPVNNDSEICNSCSGNILPLSTRLFFKISRYFAAFRPS